MANKKISKSVSAESKGPPTQSDENLDLGEFVGLQIRERRRFLGMTISELASASGVSISNLSKIETGQVSPSLQSLEVIAAAISTPIHTLFRGFDDEGTLFQIHKGKGMIMGRPGKRGGHTYELLANNTGQSSEFQAYLVTLEEQTRQRATFTHHGMEFLYMLSGAMQYRYAKRIIDVSEGDTLIFDSRTPHGPEKVVQSPARFLTVFANRRDNGD